jgi:hypothetical protein
VLLLFGGHGAIVFGLDFLRLLLLVVLLHLFVNFNINRLFAFQIN